VHNDGRVPRFEPFPGVRYDTARVDLAEVTAPPYDVIDAAERAALAARSPFNAVHVDCPVPDGGVDCYAEAAATFTAWQRDGILVRDEPSLYLYRMSFVDDAGRPRHTLGVIGALGLEPPGEGDVLPHEHTTPKAKSDRLDLMRATHANLSPIWGLSLAAGLAKLCDPAAADPIGAWPDDDGVTHELWRLTDAAAIAAVADTVARAPVVIADGHHRYETALAYQREHPGADATMTYVVELAEDELTVQGIHRLVSGLPADFDIVAALERDFVVEPGDGGALGLVTSAGSYALTPRSPRPDAVDATLVADALAGLPPHELRYRHGVDNIRRAVATGAAQAGLLLRPVTVPQIAATAHARDKFPPKTTFFWPKVRTGLVFRTLD
jgi:uncharacterized protein (DUF1015 family)